MNSRNLRDTGALEAPNKSSRTSSEQDRCLAWLTSLMAAVTPKGETREAMLAKLRTYRDCLIDDVDAMDSESLRSACRKFRWFPTIAELTEHLAERRAEKRVGGSVADGGVPPSIVNTVARMVMRDWKPPSGIGFWGGKAWEAWALRFACDQVRSGRVKFRKEFRDGMLVVMPLDGLPQPIPLEDTVEQWRSARSYLA